MCNCKKPVKPGNAQLVLVDDKYHLIHKDCEYQLELPLPIPPDPGEREPESLPQLED